MKLITYNPTASWVTEELKKTPSINVDISEIEDQSLGISVVEINVLKNGEYVRFFVRVSERNGRVKCNVATNVCDNTVNKSVTAGVFRPIR